jgi:hypothetical protein
MTRNAPSAEGIMHTGEISHLMRICQQTNLTAENQIGREV